MASTTIVVSEAGGLYPLDDVAVGVSDLENQLGRIVQGINVAVNPAAFDLLPGGSETVELVIDLGTLAPGLYEGDLLITSATTGSRSVPLSLTIEPLSVYLPLVLKDAP